MYNSIIIRDREIDVNEKDCQINELCYNTFCDKKGRENT